MAAVVAAVAVAAAAAAAVGPAMTVAAGHFRVWAGPRTQS